MADKDFKVKSGLDLGTPLPLTEGGTGQTSASNALNALLPVQTDNTSKVLQTNGTSTSWVTLPNGFQKGDTASRPGSPSLGDIYSNTQTGYIEVYTNAGWSQLGVIPESATIGTATDVGTNRPYNNGAISVTFTPSSGGGLASTFTATSTSGGYSGSASSSPITVTGIPVGTSATFTVTATNGYGNALPTTASNSATTTTVPQTPTIGTATATTGIAYGSTPTASLTFTAGETGGKTISNYKYSIDDSTYTALSPEDATSPVTIPGLTAGQSYTVKLKAVNANGDSVATSASNSILAATVPQAPTIGTVSATNETTVSVPFTAGATGGSAINSYTVTASPSVGNISTSGTTSPLTVTGTFAGGTSYTFTMTATNTYGTSSSSSSSNSILPYPAYALDQTFTSTGNYTIPSGKTKLAIFGFSGGSSGGTSGNTNDGYAASGGSGSRGAAFQEYDVTSGQVIGITVGTSNGSTVINSVTNSTNLATISPNTGTSNLPNFITVAGGGGGGGGRGAQGDTYYTAQYSNNLKGNAGAAGSALSLNLAGLGSVSYTTGSGGGGGGSGGRVFGPNNGFDGRVANGGAGGARNGNSGAGGGGGYAQADGTGYSSGGGSGENANWGGANLLGGGGAGGSGGAGYGGGGQSSISSGGAGGAGSDGKVYVYVR
jgi:hypothetical protein